MALVDERLIEEFSGQCRGGLDQKYDSITLVSLLIISSSPLVTLVSHLIVIAENDGPKLESEKMCPSHVLSFVNISSHPLEVRLVREQ